MWTEGQPREQADGGLLLAQIERHVRTIKGWVVLFGTVWVLSLAVAFLIGLALYMSANQS